MKLGRPTIYTQELASEICETISNNGVSLQRLCKKIPHWPHVDTVYAWMRKYPGFSDMYRKAKKDQVTALVDDILEISDDSSQDTYEDEKGNAHFNTEWAARSRLRVDTRKWIAAKLVPRLYGDNVLAQDLAKEIEELKARIKKGKVDDEADNETNS